VAVRKISLAIFPLGTWSIQLSTGSDEHEAQESEHLIGNQESEEVELTGAGPTAA
jgi:hypothetical protein